MSMLTVQVERLRDRARELRQGRWSDGVYDAQLMDDAADIIESLRGQLTEQTCQDAGNGKLFQCSECGSELAAVFMIRKRPLAGCPWPQYCPECGRKVVG